jgi:erythromycin esterase
LAKTVLLNLPGGVQSPQDIPLTRGGFHVQGQIHAAPGANLEGLRVVLVRLAYGEDEPYLVESRHGRVDAWLPPGTYRLRAQTGTQIERLPLIVNRALRFQIRLRPGPSNPGPEVAAWVRNHALPLATLEPGHGSEDLQAFRSIIGDARLVGLGEATHGTLAFFRLKHRILEFLIEEMGFNGLAMEAPLPEARILDAYVAEGQGDPTRALAALGGPYGYDREILGLVRWMRAYNERPGGTRKVHFYGIDMQNDRAGQVEVGAWIRRSVPEYASQFEGLVRRALNLPRYFQGPMSEANTLAWKAIAKEWLELSICLESVASKLPSAEAGKAWFRQRQNLRILSQWSAHEADPWNVRDAAMASNVKDLLDHDGGLKLVLWAHNGHIRGQNQAWMGWHLKRALGSRYRPIALTFLEGSFLASVPGKGPLACKVVADAAGTLDRALALAGPDILAIDLRKMPRTGPVRDWFSAYQGSWSIGASFTPGHDYVVNGPVLDGYDALCFVRNTSQAKPPATDPGYAAHPAPPQPSPTLPGPQNLDLQQTTKDGMPSAWTLDLGAHYQVQVLQQKAPEEGQALCLSYMGNHDPTEWCELGQDFEAKPYWGKWVRISAWAKIQTSGACQATLSAKVVAGSGIFTEFPDHPVSTKEWTHLTTEVPVVEGDRILSFRIELHGMGTAWLRGFQVEPMP